MMTLISVHQRLNVDLLSERCRKGFLRVSVPTTVFKRLTMSLSSLGEDGVLMEDADSVELGGWNRLGIIREGIEGLVMAVRSIDESDEEEDEDEGSDNDSESCCRS